MMKRILLACVSLFFLGCGNFLDINPESEVVNDDMFSTAEGVEDALYGVYMSMVKEDMYGGDMSVLIPELLGQNFVTDDGYLIFLSRVKENAYFGKIKIGSVAPAASMNTTVQETMLFEKNMSM